MGDSLPAPIVNEIDKGIKIVKDDATGKYYEINIYKQEQDPIEVCGVLMEGMTRCRNKDKSCAHQKMINSQQIRLRENNGLTSILKILSENSQGLEFQYLLTIADALDVNDLDTLDVDLKFLYAMLFKTVSNLNSEDPVELNLAKKEANELLKTIVKTKETKSKLKEQRNIDPKYMQEFVIEIFDVARKVLPKDLYQTFVQAIIDQVITPRNVAVASIMPKRKSDKVEEANIVE